MKEQEYNQERRKYRAFFRYLEGKGLINEDSFPIDYEVAESYMEDELGEESRTMRAYRELYGEQVIPFNPKFRGSEEHKEIVAQKAINSQHISDHSCRAQGLGSLRRYLQDHVREKNEKILQAELNIINMRIGRVVFYIAVWIFIIYFIIDFINIITS